MGWQSYSKNKILNSDPLTLRIRLLQKCIANMNKVKVLIDGENEKEVEARIINTYAILQELILSNDIEPETLKEDINILYSSCVISLEKIQTEKEFEKVDGIITVLTNLLDGFKGVREKYENQ